MTFPENTDKRPYYGGTTLNFQFVFVICLTVYINLQSSDCFQKTVIADLVKTLRTPVSCPMESGVPDTCNGFSQCLINKTDNFTAPCCFSVQNSQLQQIFVGLIVLINLLSKSEIVGWHLRRGERALCDRNGVRCGWYLKHTHTQINAVQATNNIQQFSFIDLFIDLFESALHVSGDKLAHLQEHF